MVDGRGIGSIRSVLYNARLPLDISQRRFQPHALR